MYRCNIGLSDYELYNDYAKRRKNEKPRKKGGEMSNKGILKKKDWEDFIGKAERQEKNE